MARGPRASSHDPNHISSELWAELKSTLNPNKPPPRERLLPGVARWIFPKTPQRDEGEMSKRRTFDENNATSLVGVIARAVNHLCDVGRRGERDLRRAPQDDGLGRTDSPSQWPRATDLHVYATQSRLERPDLARLVCGQSEPSDQPKGMLGSI